MPEPDPALSKSLAIQLDASLRDAFIPVVDRLTADGIPPVITAQAMIRFAAHIIHDAHGEKELRQTITDTLTVVLPEGPVLKPD